MTVSDGVFTADGRLFHDDELATGKLLGPKLAVLVLGSSRSPWPTERICRRVEAATAYIIHIILLLKLESHTSRLYNYN